MADLINNMRRLVRPQNTGQVEVCQSPTRYIDYAISVCKAGALLKRGAIRYRGEPALPSLRVSPTEFVQVLFNLIQNAWQALGVDTGASREVIISPQRRAELRRLSKSSTVVWVSPRCSRQTGHTICFDKRKWHWARCRSVLSDCK